MSTCGAIRAMIFEVELPRAKRLWTELCVRQNWGRKSCGHNGGMVLRAAAKERRKRKKQIKFPPTKPPSSFFFCPTPCHVFFHFTACQTRRRCAASPPSKGYFQLLAVGKRTTAPLRPFLSRSSLTAKPLELSRCDHGASIANPFLC